MGWLGKLSALILLLVGVVLSPLRAAAATIPMLIAYDVPGRPAATIAFGRHDGVRPKAGQARSTTYDDTLQGYDRPSRPPLARDAGAVCAYDDALEHADRREVFGQGAICDAIAAPIAVEGVAE